jgi:hypothetical protein
LIEEGERMAEQQRYQEELAERDRKRLRELWAASERRTGR